MRVFTLFTAMVVICSTSAEAVAQEAPPPARSQLDVYRENELSLVSTTWQGVRVFRSGVDMDVSYFGVNAEEIFGDSDTALESMARYRNLRVAGFTMYLVGLLGLVAELVALAIEPPLFIGDDPIITPVFWAWLIPATIIGLTGGVLTGAASTHLSSAVQRYNHDLYRRISGR